MNRGLYFVSLFSFFIFGCITFIKAQDNHYSWMQFGSRNSILYNAGLSRFEDQSAVIMNPATLSEATSSSFNFNTNAVGFNNISFENGLGQGFDLASSNLSIFPSMASGVLKPLKKKKKDWVLGYGFYNSNMDKLNLTDRIEERKDIIPEFESPGDENYLSQYHLYTDMHEVSVVGGLGWKVNPWLSFGFSQTFTYRSQEYIEDFSANVIPDLNTGATVDLVSAGYDIFFKYWKIYTYTKLGIVANLDKWNIGLTFNTPSIGLLGTGEMNADISLVNIRLSDDSTAGRKDYLANGRFEELKIKYKMPLSVALGASRKFGNVMMYGGINYFSAQDKYAIIDPGDASFIQPSTDENVLYTSELLTVWDAKRQVMNASIAADWIVRPNYHMLFSFRNDNYYSDIKREDDGLAIPKKTWNNYHLTFGTQRVFGASEWVIGIRLNMAKRDDYPQPFNFNDPTEDNFFRGEPKTGTITSRGLQLLLSYTFNFNEVKK